MYGQDRLAHVRTSRAVVDMPENLELGEAADQGRESGARRFEADPTRLLMARRFCRQRGVQIVLGLSIETAPASNAASRSSAVELEHGKRGSLKLCAYQNHYAARRIWAPSL